MTASSPQNCIFFQLSKASRKALRYWNRQLTGMDVTPVQAMVLLFLFDQDEITSVDLGNRAQLDSATLAGVLDRLQGAGLVERRPHPEDGRSIQVCLTGEGRGLALELVGIKDRSNVAFLECLTPEEEMILRALLCKLSN